MATWVFVFLPGKLNSWGFIAHLPLVERGVRIARTIIGDHILIEFNMKTFENLMLEQMRDRIKTITDVPKKRGEFDGIKSKKEAVQLFFRLFSGESRTRSNWQMTLKSLKEDDVITDRQYKMWVREYNSEWVSK